MLSSVSIFYYTLAKYFIEISPYLCYQAETVPRPQFVYYIPMQSVHVGAGQPSLTETLLGLMEGLLVEATSSLQTVAAYQASTSATARDINSLLEHAVHMRPGTHLHHRLLRVLPFLTYANRFDLFIQVGKATRIIRYWGVERKEIRKDVPFSFLRERGQSFTGKVSDKKMDN
jgi:hypothetical protein